MNRQEKLLKAYLITAGALLPAFTGVTILTARRKFYTWDKKQIILFAGISVASSVLLIYLGKKASN
jgi:hypothetical protein